MYALGLTSPRRPVSPRVRLTRRARSSPSTTMSSRRSRPPSPPLTPREATPTTSSSSTSSATSETRSPRRTSRSCSLSCVTLRMRMACSPTCHSWTVRLARPKHQNMSQDPRESCHQASSPGRPLSDLLCDNSLRLLTLAVRPFLKMYKNNCYEYFATIGKLKLKESQLKHPVAKNTCDLGLYWGDPEKLKHFCLS